MTRCRVLGHNSEIFLIAAARELVVPFEFLRVSFVREAPYGRIKESVHVFQRLPRDRNCRL